jgi:hypothetical protein
MPTDPPSPPQPSHEITLEEWIAAGQSCCGAADEAAQPEVTCQPAAPVDFRPKW